MNEEAGFLSGLGGALSTDEQFAALALLVLAGEFAGFSNDEWWQRSLFIPYLEQVAEWIKVMAPQGYEILVPQEELI